MKVRSLSAVAVLAVGLVLSGCAAYGPGGLKPGDDEAAVVRSMGTPTARHALPDGMSRLVYARGPEGMHTWMVELGADGRVLRWHQALSETTFERISLGMTADALLRDFGPPAHRQPLGWQPWVVWSWRYPTSECRWFQVTLNEQQRVVETGYGPDPRCEIDDEAL
jgi:hypothetical protein